MTVLLEVLANAGKLALLGAMGVVFLVAAIGAVVSGVIVWEAVATTLAVKKKRAARAAGTAARGVPASRTVEPRVGPGGGGDGGRAAG